MTIVLHDYWRSSAAYRVRIALALKRIDYVRKPVDLIHGEQAGAANRALNPQAAVPTLVIDGQVFTQSLAICDHLDAIHPEPRLIPADPAARARILAIALGIACDIHPLMNLRVLRHLKDEFAASQAVVDGWYHHWMAEGLAAIEALVARNPDLGQFAHGDLPGLADLCIVPQLYNARRFGCDLEAYPVLRRIDAAAGEIEAFTAAHPDRAAP